MPAIQRGQAYRLGPKAGAALLRRRRRRQRKSPFPSKRAALAYYRDVIEPELRGEPAPMPELTLSELVPLYLERHAATVDRARSHAARASAPRRARVRRRAAARPRAHGRRDRRWQAGCPRACATGDAALRQALEAGSAGATWARTRRSWPGATPARRPRTVRFTPRRTGRHRRRACPAYGRCRVRCCDRAEARGVARAGAPRHRPPGRRRERAQDGLQRRGRGAWQDAASRRQVPLPARALAALDEVPPRLDTRCCSRRRAAGCSTSTTSAAASGPRPSRLPAIARPARIYDLRSTFASNALAAGVSVFELARIMGTSVR